MSRGHRLKSRLGFAVLTAVGMSALVIAAWGRLAGAAQAAAPAPGAEGWLMAHAHVAGPPGGMASRNRLRMAQTWTPAGGRADPVDLAQVTFFDSVEMEAPFTRQGRPLTQRQAKKMSGRLRRVRARVRAAWRGPEDNGRLVIVGNQVMRLGALLERFDWQSLGTSSYLGQPCRRFGFRPRAGMPASGRAERVMLALTGALCVDPADGVVLEVHFHNQEPVKFGWGLLGDFHGISGSFALQRAGKSWTWGRTVVHLRGRELWFSKSGTLVKQYRLAPARLAATRH